MSLAERRRQGSGVEAAVGALSLDGTTKSNTSGGKKADNSSNDKGKKNTTTNQKESVADSWDDASVSSHGSDTETEGPSMKSSMPGPPPPTPITPGYKVEDRDRDNYSIVSSNSYISSNDAFNTTTPTRASRTGRGADVGEGPEGSPARRPDKQTATASRLIAGALGVRAPRRTEEERAYDRAMLAKEKRRRDKERDEAGRQQQERDKASAALWDD